MSKKINKVQLAEQVKGLRDSGKTWKDTASALNISVTTASKSLKLANTTVSEPVETTGTVTVTPLDKVLDPLNYSGDPNAEFTWSSQDPLKVPKNILDPKYAFRWVAKKTIENKGKGYNGWELIPSETRGNDLILAFRPKEMSEKHRKVIRESSVRQLQSIEHTQVESLERAEKANVITDVTGSGLTIGKEEMKEIIAKRREKASRHSTYFT